MLKEQSKKSDIQYAAKITADIMSEKISSIHEYDSEKLVKLLPDVYNKIFQKVLEGIEEMNIPPEIHGPVNVRS